VLEHGGFSSSPADEITLLATPQIAVLGTAELSIGSAWRVAAVPGVGHAHGAQNSDIGTVRDSERPECGGPHHREPCVSGRQPVRPTTCQADNLTRRRKIAIFLTNGALAPAEIAPGDRPRGRGRGIATSTGIATSRDRARAELRTAEPSVGSASGGYRPMVGRMSKSLRIPS